MFDRLPRTRSRCTFLTHAISTTSRIWKLIGVEAVKPYRKLMIRVWKLLVTFHKSSNNCSREHGQLSSKEIGMDRRACLMEEIWRELVVRTIKRSNFQFCSLLTFSFFSLASLVRDWSRSKTTTLLSSMKLSPSIFPTPSLPDPPSHNL